MNRLLLLVLHVCSMAVGRLEVHHEFLATKPVILLFETGTESSGSLPMILHLQPNTPKANLIHLDAFTPVFNFSIQLVSATTKTRLGSKIHRRVQLTVNQPWLNDTFIIDSGLSLSVATKFSCAPNHFGAQCEQTCDGHLAKAVRKRCDMMGRLRCDVGWMGPHCGQAVDPRKCDCRNNGACVSSFIHNSGNQTEEKLICECTNGFSGEKCEIPSFRELQYTEKKTDACAIKDACLNGAKCFPNGPKVFCACPVGFIGEFCEINLVSAQPQPSEPPAKTSGYSYTIYTLAAVFIFLMLIAACFTYKMKPRRENALSRGAEPCPFLMPETKTMLIDPEAGLVGKQKVFTIEDSVQRVDEEERYTVAPRVHEYATIQKPPPPTLHLPSIPTIV